MSGIQYVTFKASDRGGGIKSMGLLVDGVAANDRLVDPASTMVVDTAQLANGPHTVRVTVTDVAGNVTQSDPFTVTARNGGQPNGANASRTAKVEAWSRRHASTGRPRR